MDVPDFGFNAGGDRPPAVGRELEVLREGLVTGGPAADGASAEEAHYIVEVAGFGHVYEACFSELKSVSIALETFAL